jgi:plastocyanin
VGLRIWDLATSGTSVIPPAPGDVEADMRSHRSHLAAVLLGAAPLVLAACGGDGSTQSAPVGPAAEAEQVTVTIERSRYEPREIQVTPGSEVTFENLDPVVHTVTSTDGSSPAYDSGELGQDETFVQRFDEPGTHDYFCVVHPTMRGTVVVE